MKIEDLDFEIFMLSQTLHRYLSSSASADKTDKEKTACISGMITAFMDMYGEEAVDRMKVLLPKWAKRYSPEEFMALTTVPKE